MRFRKTHSSHYQVIPTEDTESMYSDDVSEDGYSGVDGSSVIRNNSSGTSCFDAVNEISGLELQYPMNPYSLKFVDPSIEKEYQNGANSTVMWRIWSVGVLFSIVSLWEFVFPYVEELRFLYSFLAFFLLCLLLVFLLKPELQANLGAKISACRLLVLLCLVLQAIEEIVEIKKIEEPGVCVRTLSELHIFTFASLTMLMKILCLTFSDAVVILFGTSVYYSLLHMKLSSPCISVGSAISICMIILFQFYVSEKSSRAQFCSYRETSSKELKSRMKSAAHYKKAALIQNQFIGMYVCVCAYIYLFMTALTVCTLCIAANMSHELRTPLTAIMGTCELLTSTKLTPAQAKLNSMCADASDMMLRLVNDIIDVSKIEANMLKLDYEVLEIHHLVKSSINIISGEARRKNIDIFYRIDNSVPQTLVCYLCIYVFMSYCGYIDARTLTHKCIHTLTH